MINDGYYIGSDLKFRVNISAPGFDQSRDEYYIDVYCGEKHKRYSNSDVKEGTDGYYLPIETEGLDPGQLKFVITAFVPDEDFNDGTRRQIAVRKLKYLKNV